jgi:hypothetical protein
MAPEQARTEAVDPRADIYAIGLVLREAVSGICPRPGTDHETTLNAARRAELLPWPSAGTAPEPPSSAFAVGSGIHALTLEPDAEPLPAALVAIIERATAALPADRYPDARAMLDDLDAFVVGERAAHKTEPPARMLAAWLAGVWDGAHDDLEPDQTLAAGPAANGFDDGAFDIVGTGTVRSLALTAGDDDAGDAADPRRVTIEQADGEAAIRVAHAG